MLRAFLLVLATLATTACGATYAFVPATNATSALYGHPATNYAIPPGSPSGDLRVASYGIEQLGTADESDQHVAALHVRVFVSNRSGQPWTFDTREQQMEIQGRATSTPAFASANPDAGSSPPTVIIGPGATRLVDLFFPLPDDMQEAEELPAFQFTSRILTEQGPVATTTPFERVEVDHAAAYAYDYSATPYDYNPAIYGYDYWDFPFWYNPVYVGFRGVRFPGYRGHPFFARGRGWGRPGYYHGPAHGAYHGGGGFHGGGGYGGGRGGGHGGGGHGH